MIRVKVLREFPLAIDATGMTARTLVVGTEDEVPEDIAGGLEAEGYVARLAGNAEVAAISVGISMTSEDATHRKKPRVTRGARSDE